MVDFTHYYNPFPSLRAMAADMRLYRDLGVEGVCLQGMGHAGGGGEFSLLRPWYGLKVYSFPEALREVEVELWAPRVTLGPGESVVLEQSLDVGLAPDE